MMGWIENRPNKFLNQNFVRQGLPAKSKSVHFRFISLMCMQTKIKAYAYVQPVPNKEGPCAARTK